MIVFLLQSYPKRLQVYSSMLFPLMVKAVAVEGPPAKDVKESAMKVVIDFRMAQIKTLAFLTIIARSPNLTNIMVRKL